MEIKKIVRASATVVCFCFLVANAQIQIQGGQFQRSGPECTLPLDTGICNLNITRFFFDLNTKSCRPFTFKGCGGNLNNYATEIDCNMRCICSRPVRPGNGNEDLVRYYYDAANDRCDQYSFSGKGGNSNRFRTSEECTKTCVVNDNSSLRRCDRMPDFGRDCGNNTIRYYYDKNCDCCREFTYLGCGGNGNRFETESMCRNRCAGDNNRPVTPAPPTPNPNSRPSMCYAQPTKGPCTQNLVRYHYDVSSGNCKPFTYSGCGGSGNNFMLSEDCVKICKASSSIQITTTTSKPLPSQCNLPLRRGNCSRIMLRFYYNRSTKSCRMFLYSGCGGNANNFLTYMDCIGSCEAKEMIV